MKASLLSLLLTLLGTSGALGAATIRTQVLDAATERFCYQEFLDPSRRKHFFRPLLIRILAKGFTAEMLGGHNGENPYEVRRMGVVEEDTGEKVAYEIVSLKGGSTYNQHSHPMSSGYFYFAKGAGWLLLKNKWFRYEPGTQVYVAPGLLHGFITETETMFLSINDPPIYDAETGHVDIKFKQ
jgi:quercetin dioxygenase-like cupin family protein